MNDTTGFLQACQHAESAGQRYLVRETDRVDAELAAVELNALNSGALPGDFRVALRFGPPMRAVLR